MNDDNHKIGMHWLKKIIKNKKDKEQEKWIGNMTIIATIIALIYFLARVIYS